VTPAPAKPATRLYVAADLAAGLAVELAPAQAHQLRNVLRLAPGAAVALFNGRDGEFLGRIEALGKGRAVVTVAERSRGQTAESCLCLAFAPIKRARLDALVEKATELGVAALQPVWTARTQVERVNLERLRAIAIEAAEQSERLAVPIVHEPVTLSALLAQWPSQRRLILCDESGRAPPIAEALRQQPSAPQDATLMVGPEGGFTESELDALAKLPFVTPVGLGPRVLRADTACLAALAVYQALAGDWLKARARNTAANGSPPFAR
jgi:16S rRNA (uracil1498-N3)-methyltransferase